MPHREEDLVQLFTTDESTVWAKEIDSHLQSVRLKLFPKSTIMYSQQDVLNELLDSNFLQTKSKDGRLAVQLSDCNIIHLAGFLKRLPPSGPFESEDYLQSSHYEN